MATSPGTMPSEVWTANTDREYETPSVDDDEEE